MDLNNVSMPKNGYCIEINIAKTHQARITTEIDIAKHHLLITDIGVDIAIAKHVSDYIVLVLILQNTSF